MSAAPVRQPNLDAVPRVDAIIAHNRDMMEREGLKHPEVLMKWKQAYSHYIPLKGAEACEDEYGGTPARGKGVLTRGPELLRAILRFSRGGDILANIID